MRPAPDTPTPHTPPSGAGSRFTSEPHGNGFAIRDAEAGLIRDSKGEVCTYATRAEADYFAEVIHRAVYPTLRARSAA